MKSVQGQARVMQQGRPDFRVGVKLQSIWGLREGGVFSVEGVAATFMMLSATAGWLPGMIAAEIVMVLAVVLLFSHLGNPWAAWRAIANIRRSWISRGTAVIGAFCGLGAVAIFLRLVDLGLPDFVFDTVYWLQMVAAVFILFYPGFAMAASAGIPFWNTGMLPILSALSGLANGGAIGLVFSEAVAPSWLPPSSQPVAELGLLAAIAICIIAFLSAAHRMGRAARLSGNRMISHEKMWFWGLAIGVGLVIPTLATTLLLLQPDFAGLTAILALAAIARVAGDISLRYAILKVGAYESLV